MKPTLWCKFRKSIIYENESKFGGLCAFALIIPFLADRLHVSAHCVCYKNWVYDLAVGIKSIPKQKKCGFFDSLHWSYTIVDSFHWS